VPTFYSAEYSNRKEVMDYTVTFSGTKRGGHKVGVKGASCSSEAERDARRQHPEHDDKPVHDICRHSNSSDMPVR